MRGEMREARSERRVVGGCEGRDARGERHGGGSEECSVFCSLELPAKNKNRTLDVGENKSPTLRMWGKQEPHTLGCGEQEPHT